MTKKKIFYPRYYYLSRAEHQTVWIPWKFLLICLLLVLIPYRLNGYCLLIALGRMGRRRTGIEGILSGYCLLIKPGWMGRRRTGTGRKGGWQRAHQKK